jgi:hypothetical protein
MFFKKRRKNRFSDGCRSTNCSSSSNSSNSIKYLMTYPPESRDRVGDRLLTNEQRNHEEDWEDEREGSWATIVVVTHTRTHLSAGSIRRLRTIEALAGPDAAIKEI